MPSESLTTSIPAVGLQQRGNVSLTAKGMVAAEPVECLIDTGAVTAIRKDTVKAASLPKYDDPRTYGLAVGEETVLSPGVMKTTITLQGKQFETTMRIFKHPSHNVCKAAEFDDI